MENKKCNNCGIEFIPSYIHAKYCSRTCSNIHRPRRKKKLNLCEYIQCNNYTSFYRDKYCTDCKSIGRHLFSKVGGKLPEESTKGDLIKRNSTNKFDCIRARARKMLENEIKNNPKCEHCGWDYHVEVCHIKPICEFPDSALITEINNRSNLKLLCPNCHWILDHPNS